MIVVDTNVVLYLVGKSPLSAAAKAAALRDPDWHAPRGWRTELAGALTGMVRNRSVTKTRAMRAWTTALQLPIVEHEYDELDLLPFALLNNVTGYDARFVRCAIDRGVRLITNDAGILANCSKWAFPFSRFAAGDEMPAFGQP